MSVSVEKATASFASLLAADPDRSAFVCRHAVATRAELLLASDQMAGYLKRQSVGRGDTICVWLPDGGVWLQLLFAAARLGVLMVPISTRLRHEEALHVVKTAQPKLIFVQPDFVGYDYFGVASEIQKAVLSVQEVVPIEDATALWDLSDYPPVVSDEGSPEDRLCTFSTSGTTGNPKLATHTQWGILHHAHNVAHFTDVEPEDASLCALPLYGVLGFMQALSALAGSGKCVFMQTFNTIRAAELIEQHRATHFYGGEGLFEDIMSVAQYDASTLKVVGFAEFAGRGLAVTKRAWQELGVPMTALYGSSECFSIMAGQPRTEDCEARAVPGGKPITAEIEFRVADVDTELVLPEHERGELQFRGYNVMVEYLNNPQATAEAFTTDGWFKSGDLGFRYGDKMAYLSRIKDTLRLRGYLVDPIEIEEFLGRHEGIQDAQVVAYRHPGRGDVAVAFIRKTDKALTAQSIYAHCRLGLANYKVPSHFVFVDDYPRKEGPNGLKILKNQLRDRAQTLVIQAVESEQNV